jgi:hypothetical protein
MMIYRTRYLARKEAKSDEVVVKVEGGYMIMSLYQYRIWKRQK